MQRRRRHSTQIIKKKNLSVPTQYSYPAKSYSGSKWKGFLVWTFVILCLATVSAYFYFGLPDPSGKEIVSSEDVVDSTTPEPEIVEPQEMENVSAPFEDNIQVEVLNGCGFNGVAKIFQTYLRENGFDVVNTDNYFEDGIKRWDISKSMVIDRVGEIEQALAVARVLNVPASRVFTRQNEESIYDVSVVIGKDFKDLSGSN